jgi:hypothetical protein
MEKLWNLISFWKNQKKYELDVDYKFVDFPDTDLTGIELLKDPYSGIVYYYTNANVAEAGLMATLKFGYMIVNPGKYPSSLLETDEKFVTIMGDILSEIILMDGQFESHRKLYSEESNL